MSRSRLAAVTSTVAVLAWGTAPDAAPSPSVSPSAASEGPRATRDRAAPGGALRADARSIPLFFEANRGQAPEGWDFLVRCRGYHAFVRSDGLCFSFDGAGLRLTLEGARDVAPDVAGLSMDARANYFLGNDETRWIRGVPLSRGARYADAAAGTSWTVGGRGRALEFTFDVRGTEPSFTLDGARSLDVDAEGRLVAEMPHGRATLSAPVAWQDLPQGRRDVAACFVLGEERRVRVALGAHDLAWPVHVDPTVSYASYLGTTAEDSHVTSAMDADGAPFLAGSTRSARFPVTSGAYDEEQGGGHDLFVVALAADGSSVEWATYLGGTRDERCFVLEVDSQGRPVVGGAGEGDDYPVTSNVVGPSGTNRNGVLTRLTADGSDLDWSTYIDFLVERVALGPEDEPHVVAGQSVVKLSADAESVVFVAPVDAPGGSVTGNTYNDAAVDADGNVYVVGRNSSVDAQNKFTQGTFQTRVAGGYDGLIAKYDEDGNLIWRTLLGGTKDDVIERIGLDGLGRPVLAGRTRSSDLPLTSDAFQSSHGKTTYSDDDSFLARFSTDGKSLAYATYLGGNAQEAVGMLRVHPTGVVVLAGSTGSEDFPLRSPFQQDSGGGWEGYVLRLDAKNRVSWASWYGGSGTDVLTGLAMGPDGTILAAGETNSTDLPTSSAYQDSLAGSDSDAMFLSIEDSLPTTLSLPVVTTAAVPDWTVGVPMSEILSLSGGTAPFEWEVLTGSLPPGLTLSSEGEISGTPTQTGTFSFTVRVVDEFAFEDEGALSMTVHPAPVVTTTSPLPPWTRGVPFDVTLTGTGGTGPLSFAAAGGLLPAGLSLGADGRLAGTPTVAGTHTFGIDVTDSVGGTSRKAMELLVNAPASIAASTLAPCTEGRPYAHTFTASGGTGELTWSVASGTVPTVEALPADGKLKGTAAAAGAYAFRLRTTDAVGGTAERDFSATIHPFPAVSTSSLAPGAAGRRYVGRVEGTGGTPPVTWNVLSGVMPTGVSVHPTTGAISGTPLAGGVFVPRIGRSDACGAVAERFLTLEVAGAVDLTKRKSSETLVLGTASPSRILRHLELLRGSSLDVDVKGGVYGGNAPNVTLVASDGTPVDLGSHAKAGRKGVKIRGVPIPATDRYFLSVAHAPGSSGKMTVVCAVDPPEGASATLPAAADPAETAFSAPPGAQVTVTVKSAKKSAALPRIVSLLDGGGADLLPGGTVKEKGKTATFRSTVPLGGGDYRLLTAARDGTAGDVVVSVRLKLPKTYDFALPDLPAGDAE